MDPLSAAGSIIAILQLTSKAIEFLYSVKDAQEECAQCAREISSLYPLLTDLSFRVNESSSDEPWSAHVRKLFDENGPIEQYKASLEQLQAKTTLSGWSNVGRAVLWKYIRLEVAEIMARIERLKSLVQIALEMDHFKLSQAIKKGVDTVQQDRTMLKYEKMLEWISFADFPAQQSDLIARREQDTGLWFLSSAEYSEWIQAPASTKTLFCPGIPGAGKSMIAAISIDHLTAAVRCHEIGVAYVYCNYKAHNEQTADHLLAAILKQLLQGRPSAASSIEILFDQHSKTKTKLSSEEIQTSLQDVISGYSSVYLVIDALDECTDKNGTRSKLLDALRAMQSRSSLQIMATSRYVPEIVRSFESALKLEVRAKEEDINVFIKGRIHQLPKCVRRDEELQKKVQEKLVEAADGMFLLARLHFDSLLDKYTKKKLETALGKLSKGSGAISQAYDEAIERIEGQLPGERELARRVLSWIILAERPLTVTELCHALAVEQGENDIDINNIPDVEDLVSVCASLTVVDHESNIIRLVHYTAQEYFENSIETWIPTAGLDISTTCLTYLGFTPFHSGPCEEYSDFQARLIKYPLLDYAANYWGNHSRLVEEEISGLALPLLQNDKLVASISQILRLELPRWLNVQYPDNAQHSVGLHLAARNGLSFHLQALLHDTIDGNSSDVNVQNTHKRTPLSFAAIEGHLAIVELLLDHPSTKVDLRDFWGRTPLSYAAENGHESVARMLLEQGNARTNAVDVNSWVPLFYAAKNGRETVTELLLEQADIEADITDADYRTPLSIAAEYGNECIAELLLTRKNVDVNLKDTYDRTPIFYAAMRGHEAVVKLLLKQDGVDHISSDFYSSTPLGYAEKYKHENIVKLLRREQDVKEDAKT